MELKGLGIMSRTDSALTPFPTTRWTWVVHAAAEETGPRRAALSSLLQRYLPPMRSYLRLRFNFDADRVEDLLQSFLTDKVLEEGLLRRADKSRGRFRNFLIRSLDHFALSRLRKENAAKRSPSGGVGRVDVDKAQDLAARSPADLFDVAWAKRVIELAVETTRHGCVADGRADLWRVFEARVLRPTLGEGEPLPLAALVDELGASSAQVSNLLSTAKRRFSRALRDEVAIYALDERDAEEELARLRRILSRSGDWP